MDHTSDAPLTVFRGKGFLRTTGIDPSLKVDEQVIREEQYSETEPESKRSGNQAVELVLVLAALSGAVAVPTLACVLFAAFLFS